MPLIPLGSDYQRRRFPRLTLTLILVCTIAWFIGSYLVKINWVIGSPALTKLQFIEQDLMMRYLDEHYSPEERSRKMFQMAISPWAAAKFEREFEEALKNGEVVPLDSPDYLDYQAALEQVERVRRRSVDYLFGYVPADPSLVSLLSYQFMHDPNGILHLFWNMVFLWLAGANLEDAWGRKYFLIVYLTGGVVSAAAHHAINFHSYVPLIGASGSIATLMGAYTYRFFRVKLRFGFFKWFFWFPAWPLLLFWFGQQVYYAIKYWGQPVGVGLWAHIGGFGFGFVSAVLLVRARAEDTFIAASLLEQDRKDREKAAQKAAKKAPPPRLAELDRAIAARQIGHLEEARELLLLAIAAAPAEAEPREEYIRLMFTMGRAGEAAGIMGDLVELYFQQGKVEPGLHWYGEICRLGLYEAAAGAWQLRLAPELARRGLFEAAAQNYRSFGEARPTDPRAAKALFTAAGLYAGKLGKAAEAMAVLDLLQRRYPTWMPVEVEQAREQAGRRLGQSGPA
jgi:membrane associated rhomboid family serine protease